MTDIFQSIRANRRRNAFPLVALMLTIAGCKPFFEEDLKNTKLNILSPQENDSLKVSTVTFFWDVVKEATTYNIQVVKGSFNSIQSFVLDSNVSDYKYTLQLNEGVYQWRIRAQNNSTHSPYITRTFTVLKTDSLTSETVILNYPADNYYTKNTSQTFRWFPLPQATYYTFELKTSGGSLVYTNNVTADSIQLIQIEEGSYQWRVRASNDLSSSTFFSRNFTIDTTTPNTPTLVLPKQADTINASYSFQWDRGIETGSPITDSLIFYGDSLMNTTKQVYVTTDKTYTVSALTTGKYFWKVRSVDAAKNMSNPSSLQKFFVF